MIKALVSVQSFVVMILCTVFSFFSFQALAQTSAADSTFFQQIANLISSYGGLTWMAKVSAICLLIVALTKTSFIAPLWAKLPALLQTLSAPILALIGGLVAQGSSLTWQSALAYVSAGAGAVVIHEILDGVKTIPGIGPTYVTIITLIESFLGGSSTPAIKA